MRVLQVLGNLGYGGIESFLMNVYRHIDRDKIQFDFLVRSDDNGEKIQEIEHMGGRVFFSPSFTRHPSANYFFVREFFKNHSQEYEVLHVHCNSFIYPLPVALAYKHKIKTIILHSHNTCNHGKLITLYHKLNEKRYDKYLSFRFACSEAAGKWMFENKPFSVIHNGIDLGVFKNDSENRMRVRSKLGLEEKNLVIGHVGRFAEQKNHSFIIDVFSKLHEKSENYKLLLVGDGELKEVIINKVAELGLTDSVVFTGNVSNVQDYMQAMNLFVLPSKYEGLGIVGIEAQACGLPCIFSAEVPNETKLTENVEFISLDDKRKWIETAEKKIMLPRTENSEKIRSAGYDIAFTTKKLEEIYLNR